MKGLLKKLLAISTAIGIIICGTSLYVPAAGAADDIVFDFDDNTTQGFEVRNDNTTLSVENGNLKIVTQAADTGIKLSKSLGIVPNEHKYVHIRMKRAADSIATKWLFQVANTSDWSTAATLNNYVVTSAEAVDSDGYFVETISFEENVFPEGANYFRFDPNRGTGYEAGTYYVDYIVISASATPPAEQETAAPEMITGINISGLDVEGFGYETLSYELKIAESKWNTLSAADVTVTRGAGFADAQAEVNVDEAQNGIKTVTIRITSGDDSQTYVVSCKLLPELSETNNDWEWEDFEDSSVSAMIGNAPLDNAESQLVTLNGRKVQKWGFKENPTNNSARWTLKPSAVLTRPAELTGKLTYEFDVLFPETNPLEKETNLQSQYALPITLDNVGGSQRMTLVYLRPHVAKNGAATADLALTEPFGWHSVKIVFDYSQTKPVYSIWVDGKVLEQNTEFDAENYNAYEKGIEFRAWVPNTFEYYIDDVRVSYIEVQPEAAEKITVAGTDVAGLSSDKFEYSHSVYEDLYDALSAEDVHITLKKEFENAEADVTLEETDGRKRIVISISQYPYSYTYYVGCEAAMRPAEFEIGKIEINGDNVVFDGRIKNDRGEYVSRDFTIIAYEKGRDVLGSYKYIGVMKSDAGEKEGSDVNLGNEFTIYETDETPKLYEMNILFDAYGLDAPVEETVLYTNEEQLEKSIEWLKASDEYVMDYITTEDETNGVSSEWNKEIFRRIGVDVDEYESMEDAKEAIKNAVEPYKMSLTRDNASAIINGSVIAVRMSDDEISAEKKIELIAEFDENTMAVEVSGATNGVKIGFSDMDEASRVWITDNLLLRNSEFESYEILCDEIRKSILLDLINNAEYSELYGLITNNTDVLDDSMTKLAAEKNTSVIDAAMKEIKLQAYNSDFMDIDDFVAAVKDAHDEALKSSNSDKNPGSSLGGGGLSGGGGSSGGGGGAVTLGGGSGNAVGGSASTGTGGNASVLTDRFNDIQGFEWAKEAIEELASKGIVSGVGNGSFEPEREITREEFVKLICEAFGFEGEAEISFTDINDDDWFKPYVAIGFNNGIITGVSDELFGSGRSITREEMAAIIYRAIIAKGKSADLAGTEFADNDDISGYANDAVARLSGAGIVNGVGDNMFAPQRSAVRAEAAVIIHRCMEAFLL